LVPFFSGPRPRLFGHRGAAGEAPENTIASFRLALEQGAEIFETDVRASSDGEVLVFHDSTLERTTDGSGPVHELPAAVLQSLDAGYRFSTDQGKTYPYRGIGIRIPTLKELISEFPGVPLNIEIKQEDPPIVEAVVKLIRQAGRPVLLAAANDSIMRQIRAVAPDIPTSFAAGEVATFVRAVFACESPPVPPGARALQIPPSYGGITLVTSETVEAAHRAGLEMHVWTINEREEIRQLLALGVDGIVTDFPALALAAFRQR